MSNRHTIAVNIECGILQKLYLNDVKPGDIVGLVYERGIFRYYSYDYAWAYIDAPMSRVVEKGAKPVLIAPAEDWLTASYLHDAAERSDFGRKHKIEVVTLDEWQELGASR